MIGSAVIGILSTSFSALISAYRRSIGTLSCAPFLRGDAPAADEALDVALAPWSWSSAREGPGSFEGCAQNPPSAARRKSFQRRRHKKRLG